ncbi:hypothetical protein GOODEAATRI_032232, partial [Goodea atripinnis]
LGVRSSCSGAPPEFIDMSHVGVETASKMSLSVGGAKSSMHSLKQSWHVLKKHYKLSEISAESLAHLKQSKGFNLAHLDHGYTLDLICMPKGLGEVDRRDVLLDYLPICSLDIFNQVMKRFVALLQELPPEELGRDTLKKTVLVNKGSMNILRQDKRFILSILDQAIATFDHHESIVVRPFVYKFGQKCQRPLEITEITFSSNIVGISVHVGCNLTPVNPNSTIFWARAGMEMVTGTRCKLYPCMGMHEAVNMQTTLGRMYLDISPDLIAITNMPSMNFFQMYVDSPHIHNMSTFRHPVSGMVVTAGLSHPKYNSAISKRAEEYVLHMEDMARKSRCRFSLRIEQVVLLDNLYALPEKMSPVYFYNIMKIKDIFRRYPMVVPFVWEVNCVDLHDILYRCLNHMTGELKRIGAANQGKGGFHPTWKTFQLELVLEEAQYGHPLSMVDVPYTTALGTSSLYEFSLTHTRGFMALGPHNAAAVEEGPPPLKHWTKDSLQEERIARLFPLTSCLQAEAPVVGAQLIMVLLKDLYRRNERIPMANLKGTQPPQFLKGHVSIQQLSQNLESHESFPNPFTFGRAKKLIKDNGKDVVACLEAGFKELKIRYFPELKYCDLSGHRKATWNFLNFVEIHWEGSEPSDEAKARSVVGDVAMEMERRGLCYARTLERYKEYGMPWLSTVMPRLPERMGKDRKFKVLVFLSSVGLLMNNDFISFDKLKQLIMEMGVSQAELQALLVLSSSLLPKAFGFNLWKLHYTVPYRMNPVTGVKRKIDRSQDIGVEDEEDGPLLDDDEQPEVL